VGFQEREARSSSPIRRFSRAIAASVAALTGGGFIVGWGADNGDFDLSNSKHGILYNTALFLIHIYLKILNISHEIELCMNPIRMPNSTYVFIKLWVFIWF